MKKRECVFLACLALSGAAGAQVTASGNGSGNTNGFTALEGTAIGGVSNSDTMWADSTDQRWKVNNHDTMTNYDLALWPCGSAPDAGGIVYAGGAISGVNAESCLQLSSDPGVPLLAGTSSPQWGGSIMNGSSSVSLDLQGWAEASEVLNETATGTVVNTLAKITSTSTTGAIQATTADTTIPTYIVVGGAGKTGNAQLGLAGQAYCKMDATNGAGVEGQPVFTSSSVNGDCTTSTSVPLGAWVVGQMISNTTTSGSNSIILVRPGFRALPSTFLGSGTSIVLATTLSNSSGTELATASGTLTSTHLAKFDSSGDVADSGIALASVSGNTTEAATVSGSLVSGDAVKVDANGNIVDAGFPNSITVFPFTAGASVSATATQCIGVGQLIAVASETQVEIPISRAATASNMYCRYGAALTGTQQGVITLRHNAASSSITCTVNSTNQACNDTTHNFTVAAGDTLEVQWAPSNSPTGSSLNCTVNLQ
jgi:hypothetical protein